MQFRTPIKLKEAKFKIDTHDRILLMGSCFSEHIAERLKSLKWNICHNPHGILFNPASIHTSINEVVNARAYTHDDLFFHNELWYSWQHHGRFSDSDSDSLLIEIDKTIHDAHNFLKGAEVCILTLGSAWVYRHIEQDMIVANCHKMPQSYFRKTMLTIDEINGYLLESLLLLRRINPTIKVLLTLSPVRYLKDGFTENALSKAHLLSAIHQVIQEDDSIEYFPAYEIFMDDLRDYRFNTTDLVHPNDQAVDYIWEKYLEFSLPEASRSIINELSNWRKQMDHRAFHEETEQYKKFKMQLLDTTIGLQKKLPFLSFEEDLASLSE